jgi:hypothetical protein
MRLISLAMNMGLLFLMLAASDYHSDKAICAFGIVMAVGNYYHGFFNGRRR